MPSSDHFLPRASQAPVLGADAIEAYRAAGWRITADGRVDTGQTTGRCTRCGRPTVRYGPQGHPVCAECLGGAA